jgi:hypothetical protein
MHGHDPRSYGEQVAFGNIRNAVPWAKIGYNPDVDAGTEDVWMGGGVYAYPAAGGIQMQVVSSSGTDTLAGAGVQKVRINYLDPNYAEQSEVVNLNGVGAVNTVAVNIFRVQSFRAAQCGANKLAAGNISLQSVGGATTYGVIGTGLTRGRAAIWTVPAGKRLYIQQFVGTVGGTAAAKVAIITLRYTYDDYTQTVTDFFLPCGEWIIEDGGFSCSSDVPAPIAATVDIKASVTGLVADCRVSVMMRGFLVTL